MIKSYDVVIIGAGPAGLMAAKTTKLAGMNVLLVEQKTKIARVRRTCAEGLITKPNCNGETVTVEGKKITFRNNGFSIPYHGPWIDMQQFLHISPDGSKVIIAREEVPVAKIFNKEVLLEELLAEVKRSGCEIANETMGIKAENTKEGVLVSLQCKGVRQEVRSRFAIAADGVNSRIVESLGLNKKRKFFGAPRLVSYWLEGVETPMPDAFIFFIGGHSRQRVGYFMPKAPSNPKDPQLFEITASAEENLKRFLTKGNYSSWFKQAKVVRKTSAILNFYTPIRRPVIGNIMIVGDAACFIEAYVQGAIMYGFRAAKSIAQELHGSNGFEEYVRYWQASYAYNRRAIMEQACRVALGLPTLEDKELDYLFALLEPHKIRAYYDEFSYPQQIIAAIGCQIPRIRGDYPDLARKIEVLLQATIEEILSISMKRYAV